MPASKISPPGFRFCPTEHELLLFYLKRKITGENHGGVIEEIDLYSRSPWDLPGMSLLQTGDKEWYFYCPQKQKYAFGQRKNRSNKNGSWSITGYEKRIYNDTHIEIGSKKTLVYHCAKGVKKVEQKERTDWVMHEYRLNGCLLDSGESPEAYVVCRVFQKSGKGPKVDEEYGAPFREEDWKDKDFQIPIGIPTLQSGTSKNGGYYECPQGSLHLQKTSFHAVKDDSIGTSMEQQVLVNPSESNGAPFENGEYDTDTCPHSEQSEAPFGEGKAKNYTDNGIDISMDIVLPHRTHKSGNPSNSVQDSKIVEKIMLQEMENVDTKVHDDTAEPQVPISSHSHQRNTEEAYSFDASKMIECLGVDELRPIDEFYLVNSDNGGMFMETEVYHPAEDDYFSGDIFGVSTYHGLVYSPSTPIIGYSGLPNSAHPRESTAEEASRNDATEVFREFENDQLHAFNDPGLGFNDVFMDMEYVDFQGEDAGFIVATSSDCSIPPD